MNIDDRLLARAKALAAVTGRPLGAVIDDALRVLLARADHGQGMGPVELPTYGGSGLQPGVDLENKEALAALLEAGDAEHDPARRVAKQRDYLQRLRTLVDTETLRSGEMRQQAP